MIFTASVQKIFDQPAYKASYKQKGDRKLIDIRQMQREEISCAQFDCISLEETEQGQRRQERGFCLKDFKITERLGEGGFGQVVLAKKSTSGHSSSEEVFALNLVPTKHMSVVE
jgi:serine/threonine protein kinase